MIFSLVPILLKNKYTMYIRECLQGVFFQPVFLLCSECLLAGYFSYLCTQFAGGYCFHLHTYVDFIIIAHQLRVAFFLLKQCMSWQAFCGVVDMGCCWVKTVSQWAGTCAWELSYVDLPTLQVSRLLCLFLFLYYCTLLTAGALADNSVEQHLSYSTMVYIPIVLCPCLARPSQLHEFYFLITSMLFLPEQCVSAVGERA